jgi:hypothetical protein
MNWLQAWEKERDEREEANRQQREKSTAMNKGVCDGQELAN